MAFSFSLECEEEESSSLTSGNEMGSAAAAEVVPILRALHDIGVNWAFVVLSLSFYSARSP